MRMIICRHGEPEGTESGKRYLGITDEPLSDKGMEQADRLGIMLSVMLGCDPDFTPHDPGRIRIISSNLIRAYETALVIREHLGCEFIETDRDLRETDMGEWDGRLFEDIRRDFPEEYEARGRDLFDHRAPGGESFREAGARFCRAAEGLADAAGPGDTVIIVSHLGAVRAGLSLLTGKPFEESMKIRIPYAGGVILSRNGRIFRIEDRITVQ